MTLEIIELYDGLFFVRGRILAAPTACGGEGRAGKRHPRLTGCATRFADNAMPTTRLMLQYCRV
jgi:hypothetical protein